MNNLIDNNPNKRGQKLTIKGTRLYLSHLWDHLKYGYTVEEYCNEFSVKENKVRPIAKFFKSNE